MQTHDDLRAFLAQNLHPLRNQIGRIHLDGLTSHVERAKGEPLIQRAVQGALALIAEQDPLLRINHTRSARLTHAYLGAESDDERMEVMRLHLFETVHDPAERRRDERALHKWLDLEALLDREAREAHGIALQILCALDIVVALGGDKECHEVPSQELATLQAIFAIEGDPLVRERAAEALQQCAGHIPGEDRPRLVSMLLEVLGEKHQPKWVRVRALETLCVFDRTESAKVIRALVTAPDSTIDAVLLRRHAVRLSASWLRSELPLRELENASTDASEHVRQEFTRACRAYGSDEGLARLGALMRDDRSAKVRAVATTELLAWAQQSEAAAALAGAVLTERIEGDPSSLVSKLAIEGIRALVCGGHWVGSLNATVRALERVSSRPEGPARGELAASTLAALQAHRCDVKRPLVEEFRRLLDSAPEGRPVETEVDERTTIADIQNALRVATWGDMSVSAAFSHRRVVLQRGEARRIRFWRVLYETRRPAPDKRQGLAHTTGRDVPYPWVVPPRGLSEVTQTSVPGERRYVARLSSWAPYLPRVDDVLDACVHGVCRTLICAVGTVTLTPPRSRMRRLWLRLRIAWSYGDLAALREAALDAQDPARRGAYIQRIRQLGIQVDFQDLAGQVGDSSFVVRYPFAHELLRAAPMVPLFALPEEPLRYLLSPHGNTPAHLAALVAGLLSTFILRAWVKQVGLRHAIRKMQLVIGGWGTRGKSGTERLKAALFHALGCDVTVKTTGCEAMFIHGVPGRQAHEVFLYRPGDKATIWEQAHVVDLAASFGSEVFLWECMALRPHFVEILAHLWMKGSIATITNAYPDHEDVMGPTGEDVARVIGGFAARGGKTLTTEDQMLPILREEARNHGSDLVAIPPVIAECLPTDLLDRYPYQEHPLNISLVIELAKEFGVDWERAVVDMADFVVPDLGVLKTYPEVEYRGRTLFFSNGMSANERAGCLGNWQRLGLDKHTPDRDAETTVVTVINNRADRVPRSRVFARIAVEDIAVDLHVCIGTNLAGLRGFIAEELDLWLARQHVFEETGNHTWSDQESRIQATEAFRKALIKIKVPTSADFGLQDSLRRMLTSAGVPEGQAATVARQACEDPDQFDSDKILEFLKPHVPKANHPTEVSFDDIQVAVRRCCKRARTVREAQDKIVRATSPAEANEVFRQCFRTLFMGSVVLIDNAYASGDRIIHTVAEHAAPGQRVHIIGLQNIKGTGLGFVYRWISVGTLSETLALLNEPVEARSGALNTLASYSGYGLIDAQFAWKRILAAEALDPSWAETEGDKIGAVKQRLLQIVDEGLSKLAQGDTPGRMDSVLAFIEKWLDPIDSIFRRYRANAVRRALVAGRIGHGRAAILMRELTSRDKGGWLVKEWRRRFG